MIGLGLEPLFQEWLSTSRGKGKNNQQQQWSPSFKNFFKCNGDPWNSCIWINHLISKLLAMVEDFDREDFNQEARLEDFEGWSRVWDRDSCHEFQFLSTHKNQSRLLCRNSRSARRTKKWGLKIRIVTSVTSKASTSVRNGQHRGCCLTSFQPQEIIWAKHFEFLLAEWLGPVISKPTIHKGSGQSWLFMINVCHSLILHVCTSKTNWMD